MIKHNVIWYSFALLFLCILVLTISVSGQEIQVDPEFIEVNLTGGDTITKSITVKWTGSNTIQCFISTNITSDCPGNDSEGINVTYSEPSPFNLTHNVDYIVEMTIKVSPNLMPGIYIITTNFSCEAEEPPAENGDNGGWSPHGSSSNIAPVADASAGEPYTGIAGEEITFDGSKSFDIDGTIIKWYWDFGDGTDGNGRITTHTYSNPGTYYVTLTVTDNRNAIDLYETTAIIRNRPPTTPIIDGTKTGNKTVEYTYTTVSTDPENDTIRYFFEWGDGTIITSDFLASGTAYSTTHTWTDSGVYTVSVYAEDINGGVSDTTEMIVFIDVNVLFIDDVIQGYLLDGDNDGIYDVFHNNATENKTVIKLQDNGNYLIDSDSDGLWDYEYNPKTNTLILHIPVDEEEDITLWYALFALIVMAAISAISFVYLIHRAKNKKKN